MRQPAKRLSSTLGITGPPRLMLHLKTGGRRLRVHGTPGMGVS